MVKSHFFVREGNGSTEAVSVTGSILTQVAILNTLKLRDAGVCQALCQEAKKYSHISYYFTLSTALYLVYTGLLWRSDIKPNLMMEMMNIKYNHSYFRSEPKKFLGSLGIDVKKFLDLVSL